MIMLGLFLLRMINPIITAPRMIAAAMTERYSPTADCTTVGVPEGDPDDVAGVLVSAGVAVGVEVGIGVAVLVGVGVV